MTPSSAGAASLSPEQRAAFERSVARFEEAWFSGLRPVIEAFLPDDPGLRVALLAELVRVDMEFRAKAGEAPQVDEYLARFPELAENESFVRSRARDSGELSFGEDRSVGGPRVGESGPHVNVRSGSGQAGKPDVHPGQAGKPDVRALIASRLVTEQQVQECLKVVGSDGAAAPEQLLAELRRRGWVTSWQLQQLERGQAEFFVDQGRYLLLGLIGQGGMGAVYKARHVRMNRDVALKVIDPKRVTDQSLIQRFRREVEVCSKLQNEHIVQAFDCGIHAGAIFLVLEFVEGSDLASLVKRDGPMRPDEAAAVCLQAAAGLAYAHSQGVVHRDIKPQNILLSSAGVVKILDMGLARLLDDPAGDPHTSLTQEGAVMGTVDYMPPEQARDTRLADARSDIYSLGATLYYLLAGRPPFGGGSVIEKMQRLALESPQSLTEVRIDCPPALDGIVQRMLAKRPEERFPTAGDVVRALRPFAAERIAGRTVVTAAVQSAADTQQVALGTDTTFETAFVPEYESILTTRKRQSAGPRASLFAKVTAGITAAAALIVVLIAWSLSGKSRPTAHRPPPRPSEAPAAEKPPAPPAPETIVRELPGPFGTPTSLAWSPNGQRLAVGTLDGDVWVRTPDRPTLRPIRYSEHASSVVAVTWIPDSELIASAEDAGEIHLWNAATGKTQRRIKRRRVGGYQNSAWSARLVSAPDGRELAYTDGPGTIVRLRLPDAEPLGSIALAGRRILADACYSPSGEMIGISCSYLDNTFQVLVADLRAEAEEPSFPIGAPTTGVPLMVAFAGDEELAIASEQRVEVWNVSKRELARRFEIPHSEPVLVGWTRHGGVTTRTPRFACWSGENEMQLLSPVDGTATRVPIGMPGIIDYSTSSPLDFAPDLSRAAYWPAVLAVARVADGETKRPWGGEQFGFINEKPHVHGNVLLQISNQQTWDLRTGELRPDLAGKLYVARPGGLIQVLDGETIRFYSDAGGSQEAAPPVILEGRPATEDLYGCRWSRDGRRLFQFRDDRVLHVWDADTGRKVAALQAPDSVNAYDATCDGKMILLSAGQQNFLSTEPHDAPLREFTASNERQSRRSIAGDGRFAVWIEPGTAYRIADGRAFALGASELSMYADNGIDVSRSGDYLLMSHGIWRLSGAAPEKLWQCPEKPRAVHVMHNSRTYVGNAWFEDEEHVAIAMDASVQIWNWRKNVKRATLYLMPENKWAFVNQDTHCWNGSAGAERYLRYEYFDKVRDRTIRVDPAAYGAETGWKNDPKKAALGIR